MHEHLARFTATEGVLFVGRAQEKTRVFRTEKRRDAHGDSYPWIVRTTGLVNQFYFDRLDADFGPFCLKFCSYFPYNAKLCINGHEWAKRQAAQAGIAFTALDSHLFDWERSALVTDVEWMKHGAKIDAFLGFLIPGGIRAFSTAEAAKARDANGLLKTNSGAMANQRACMIRGIFTRAWVSIPGLAPNSSLGTANRLLSARPERRPVSAMAGVRRIQVAQWDHLKEEWRDES